MSIHLDANNVFAALSSYALTLDLESSLPHSSGPRTPSLSTTKATPFADAVARSRSPTQPATGRLAELHAMMAMGFASKAANSISSAPRSIQALVESLRQPFASPVPPEETPTRVFFTDLRLPVPAVAGNRILPLCDFEPDFISVRAKTDSEGERFIEWKVALVSSGEVDRLRDDADAFTAMLWHHCLSTHLGDHLDPTYPSPPASASSTDTLPLKSAHHQDPLEVRPASCIEVWTVPSDETVTPSLRPPHTCKCTVQRIPVVPFSAFDRVPGKEGGSSSDVKLATLQTAVLGVVKQLASGAV